MHIKENFLYTDDDKKVSAALSSKVGGILKPRYLIMHYTAGSSAKSSIDFFLKKETEASAHLVIGRDGSITQMVPFDRVAWHAGKSRWHEIVGLNQHSIGIELDNAGPMQGAPGKWRSSFGRLYPDEEIITAVHKFENVERGWHLYTEVQLAAALEAAHSIVAHYKLVDVLGHDDIAPERKQDPGPAFPMESFRAKLLGRAEDEFEMFETVTSVNVREGPGVNYTKIDGSPFAKGTRLKAEMRNGLWFFAEILDKNGEPDKTGWVHGNYIKPV